MIGDQYTAMYLQNPAAAQALRRQQLGINLAQAGISGEPIRAHSQGLNRMAQALIGALLMNKADNEFTAQAEKSDRALADWNAMTSQLMGVGGGGGAKAQPPASPAAGPPIMAPAAIHQIESGGSMRPGIYGDGGRAAGPMQVHPAALADVNRQQGTNYTHAQLAAEPEIGRQVGDAYYQQMLQQFGGDPAKAAAAYNAGPGRVAAAVSQYGEQWQQGIPEATRAYVAQVTGAAPAQAPQAAPTPARDVSAELARAQQLTAIAMQAANHSDPRIRAQAPMLMQRAGQEEARAMAEQARREAQANRVPSTITLQDPDGKNVGIYEMTPGGPGRRLGNAPRQPGEAGGPFAGTGMEQQAANTLIALGPKIQDGTATPAERGQYALAYEHVQNGKIAMVPDPTDPTGQRQVMARIPGNVPSQFPAPSQTSGGAQAGQAAPAGTGAAGAPQVIPGTAKTQPTTEGERIGAGYAVRMREAGAELNALERRGVHSGNTVQAMAGAVPGVGNFLTSADYQVYQQQMQDWVRAKLRRESGAVIGVDEMRDEIKTYFPQPGDSAEKIEAKRRSREIAEKAMDEAAGRAKIEAPAKPNTPTRAPPAGFQVVP